MGKIPRISVPFSELLAPKLFLKERARSHAKQAERLIERIDFWRLFAPFSNPMIARLVRKMEEVTAEAERFMDMAGE